MIGPQRLWACHSHCRKAGPEPAAENASRAMTLKILVLIFLASGIFSAAGAQTSLTGVVTVAGTEDRLSFVNIGIRHKNLGTVSRIDGTFSLSIPGQNEKDTLVFSMLGYEELLVPIRDIIGGGRKQFGLKAEPARLNTVTVSAGKLTERKFGITSHGALMHISDGSTNQDDIFEIAQLVKLDTLRSRLTSVNLYLNASREDSGTFRINFYRFDGSRPAERIIERSIIQKKKIQEGWLKFDLAEYGIYLKGTFVVALEFIPTKDKSSPIYYELKLGGSSKSFVRTSSQGDWSVPPHHYRLFVTALVADRKDKKRPDNPEEKESLPAFALYSESVRDSFYIFIRSPKQPAKKGTRNLPVIYLLDANVYFDHVAEALEENNIGAMLVGIGYKDVMAMDSLRKRDYLYPRAAAADEPRIGGGAQAFLAFIETELKPCINRRYAADTGNQTLMGHSFGGYFVLYALLRNTKRHTATFRRYVAASPSLDYSDRYLLKQFQDTADTASPGTLVLTYGGREDSEDGGSGTEGIDNFNRLKTLLSEKRYGNIRLKAQIYPTSGHMETAVPTFTGSVRDLK